MASVRQLPSGRWQLRVHTGRDPLTGAKRWATKTVDATGKRDAQHQANAWEVDLREHDASTLAGRSATWPPSGSR